MTTAAHAPSPLFVPVAPDADWETVRARVMAALTASRPRRLDRPQRGRPGRHPRRGGGVRAGGPALPRGGAALRRVAARGPGLGCRTRERHWHATLPSPPTGCPGRDRDSLAALGRPRRSPPPPPRWSRWSRLPHPRRRPRAVGPRPVGDAFDPGPAPAVIALMRSRLVRQVAQEQADVIAGAVAAEREPDAVHVARRDARAAAELAFSLPLWEDEIARPGTAGTRRRLSRRPWSPGSPRSRRRPRPAACSDPGRLQDADLDRRRGADRDGCRPQPHRRGARGARGRPTAPPDLAAAPDPGPDLRAGDRRRLRPAGPRAPAIHRAWAVPGRLDGHRLERSADGDHARRSTSTRQAAAVTLVVERDPGRHGTPPTRVPAGGARGRRSARRCDAPFPDWRDDTPTT